MVKIILDMEMSRAYNIWKLRGKLCKFNNLYKTLGVRKDSFMFFPVSHSTIART